MSELPSDEQLLTAAYRIVEALLDPEIGDPLWYEYSGREPGSTECLWCGEDAVDYQRVVHDEHCVVGKMERLRAHLTERLPP